MTDNERIEQIEKENIKLKEKLLDFKQLEEDLLADKVFKKAKDKLVSWYTIGGIAIFIIGMVGIKSIYDYSKELVSRQIDTFTKEKINEIIINESHKQVETLLIKQQDTLTKQFKVLYDDAKNRLDLSKYGYGAVSRFDTVQEIIENTFLTKVDLSSRMNPVRNQGPEASNPAFTIAAALEYALLQKNNYKTSISPRYIYNGVNNKDDRGASITDIFNFLSKTGAIEEFAWPYKPGEYRKDPPPSTVNSKHFKISSYKTIKTDLNTFKSNISNENCIVAGMWVYNSFSSFKNGVYLTPKTKDYVVAAIVICIVGFDDNSELIKVRLTFGTEWGDKGYGYIKYADIAKLMTDSYVINL